MSSFVIGEGARNILAERNLVPLSNEEYVVDDGRQFKISFVHAIEPPLVKFPREVYVIFSYNYSTGEWTGHPFYAGELADNT